MCKICIYMLFNLGDIYRATHELFRRLVEKYTKQHTHHQATNRLRGGKRRVNSCVVDLVRVERKFAMLQALRVLAKENVHDDDALLVLFWRVFFWVVSGVGLCILLVKRFVCDKLPREFVQPMHDGWCLECARNVQGMAAGVPGFEHMFDMLHSHTHRNGSKLQRGCIR